MTLKEQFKYGHYFFHFGVKSDSLADGPPLVCLNGGIMADTGSESLSYIYVCQDRYPVYAGLSGMRCLLFVRDDEHLQHYHNSFAEVSQHFDSINEFTKVFPDNMLHEPLYMPADINALDIPLADTEAFVDQTGKQNIINSHVRGGIYLNQISPTISKLIAQFYGYLANGDSDFHVQIDQYHHMAQEALKWHNKSQYVQLLQTYDASCPIPSHVPTAIFSSHHLNNMTWDKLVTLVQEKTGCSNADKYFVKSSMDAAGEVNVILSQKNFTSKSKELAKEIAIKVTDMNRTETEVQLLVQPCIERPDNDGDWPTSVGITYNIYDSEHIERLVIAGHVYEDVERKTFIGSYLCDDLTEHVLQKVGEDKIVNLLRLFAEQGYRGPINLDAVRNHQGEYIFIYDCNPRIGGSLPGLIIKNALEEKGMQVESLFTLGYRGRIVYLDIKSKLVELEDLGLLYTRNRQRGVYILPNMVRSDSYDLILINMKMDDIHKFISSGRINSLSEEQSCDLGGVCI